VRRRSRSEGVDESSPVLSALLLRMDHWKEREGGARLLFDGPYPGSDFRLPTSEPFSLQTSLNFKPPTNQQPLRTSKPNKHRQRQYGLLDPFG
jgi:hypothetical protein